ncbi:MAG: hypothetical protein R3C62_11310 [Chloroflexota bacterium]
MQTATTLIELDHSDDLVSVLDRLVWAREQRLLLVDSVGVLHKGTDLVRLRRLADQQRLEVGLVTADKRVRRQALALGIPAFASAETAQQSRRGWWRGRQRREQVGVWRQDELVREKRPFPPLAPPKPKTRTLLHRWLLRYAATFLFFVTVALLVVLFLYRVPRATLTLHPKSERITQSLVLTADPTLATASGQTLPAERVTAETRWQGGIPVNGVVTAEDQARLQAQGEQFMRTVALADLGAQQRPFLLPESVQLEAITQLTFSHPVGAATERLGLEMGATWQGTAVDLALATPLALAELQTAVSPGYDLQLDSLSLQPEAVQAVDETGRTTFTVTATAQSAAVLAMNEALTAVAGQPPTIAQAYLAQQLPLAEPPTLTIWPTWFGRLPYVVERMETAVVIKK